MSFPQSSRAYASWRYPQAWGICDRCGFRYLRNKLNWQYDWRGNRLQNLYLAVDHRCLDEPQPNGRRPIIIGPDPVPVANPRPGWYATQMEGSVPAGPVPPSSAGNFILDSSEFGILDQNTLASPETA